MEQVHPTRMELIRKRSQIAIAEQGRDLLKKKMEAMVIEFYRIIVPFTRLREELEEISTEAERSLLIAEAIDDPVSVKSASFATKRLLAVDITGKNIMGVPVPVIQKKSVALNAIERGYSIIGTSGRIDEVAEKYESAIDLIIRLAETETTLQRLGDEIRMNRRRVNTLDQIVIPELKRQARYIRYAIDEREREDIFRLKKVKKMIKRRRGRRPY